VVHLALLGAADDLAVQRVLHAVFDLNDDGLVHLVADDVAALRLAVAADELGVVGNRCACLRVSLSHYLASSVSVASAVASALAESAFAASAFLGLVFFSALGAVSTGAGVARMPSSRSRITV